jgi:hypothetical protein
MYTKEKYTDMYSQVKGKLAEEKAAKLDNV